MKNFILIEPTVDIRIRIRGCQNSPIRIRIRGCGKSDIRPITTIDGASGDLCVLVAVCRVIACWSITFSCPYMC